MEVSIISGKIRGSELFRLVWRGYFIAATAIMLPLSILAAVINLSLGGEQVGWQVVLIPLFVPFIIAFQGIIVGGLVLLGLLIRPPKTPETTAMKEKEGRGGI